ncbi:Transcription-repair coupling factor [hydrothermal vent metagenome]|uniref:Transcription-repair coupling factor n=1 Tax=hydrothermal vent metagenome TaxID=652676 RepID=A0A3B0UTR3_9ZZZZ
MPETVLEQQQQVDRPSRIMANVPDGMQASVLALMVEKRLKEAPEAPVSLVFVARDGARMQRQATILQQIMPGHQVLTVPAWDCLPYDRVSPNAITVAARMNTLAALTNPQTKGAIILSAANALVQFLPPREIIGKMSFGAKAGEVIERKYLVEWAAINGYLRVPNVREAGEFAVRGGLVDLFPAGHEAPLRFDFFGSVLETIRTFDPDTQRTTGSLAEISLAPMSEIILTPETIRTFRRNYTSAFGGHTVNDPLYAAISAGQRFAGAEHWLAFFYPEMNTLADYCNGAPFVFDDQCETAIEQRRIQVKDYYQARREAQAQENSANSSIASGARYNPMEPGLLYDLSTAPFRMADMGEAVQFSSFLSEDKSVPKENMGGQLPPSFAAVRQAADTNLFEAVIARLNEAARAKKKTIIACWSEGTRDRMAQVLADHGLKRQRLAENWLAATASPTGTTALVIVGLDSGFETKKLLVLSEQDILGERIIANRRRKKVANALTEASSLASGDFVVHIDHGIGRFVGLKAIDAMGAPHDCVEIEYSRGDKLYLPVENIELLTRYGEGGADSQLDRLGGVAWQAKKSKLKKRILEMAEQLIRIAAGRTMSKADPIKLGVGLYDEFATRFAFEETEDQLTAIDNVIDDLSSGRVMDRLVCGDVGFGKTEVALRAAFSVALSGRQVAVVVPTTLLARQHYKTFKERFAGLPVNVAQASRLVPGAEMKKVRQGLSEGKIDIVIGTHALLAKSIKFYDLGLLVIDEEQHFGVGHKERLKELKSDVHVLTLSATPIPRTLQMALSGVRDLSLLATPPVDRLAIRTFISPFDALSVREALLREKYRGGQAFYVVPRVSDQAGIAEFLEQQVPEISFVVANGQMPPSELDDIMNAFYDGRFDVLVATTIVESGLDIPNANTLIVHRADMFGLAQLYQIRGRIGRSKVRAYAVFTVPANQRLSEAANRRLQVLQSLNSLGAGFQLASHDLDIRGAGNILGEEQSGHIREVGFELYQAMLEEAVASLRDGGVSDEGGGGWSPQISLGMPVMIPENYVPDLQVRMQLYRRLGDLSETAEIDSFGAELIDRFGPLPEEVNALLKVVVVKALCRTANVEKIDAGPKGAVIALRHNSFPNPAGLVKLVSDPAMAVRLKPDHRLVFSRTWPTPEHRLKGTAALMLRLARIAEN